MRKITLLIGLLLTAGIACAGNTLLWKVSGNGLPGTSYILGSHHMAPAEFIDSITGLREALDEVTAVYGEVTKDALNGPEAQQKMMNYAMAPADSTLSKALGAPELARLDSLLACYTGMTGMTAQFEPLKPAVVSAQIAMMQMMKIYPQFQSQQPFDIVVLSLAESKGKEMGGLETPESQMELIFGDPISIQAKDLMEAVDNDKLMIQQVQALTETYLKQDIDAMTEIVTDERFGATPESLERLIYRRNRAWADELRQLLPQKTLLVVVGAGHLGGEEGLLNLLRRQGFTVEPAIK